MFTLLLKQSSFLHILLLLLCLLQIQFSSQDPGDLEWWRNLNKGMEPSSRTRSMKRRDVWKMAKQDILPKITDKQKRMGYSEDIILIDGVDKSEGTVLVNVDGRWGTICDDTWTLVEANVVCRMLGYPHALRSTTRDYFFTSRDHDYVMDDVKCFGDEDSLFDCSFWSDHDCRPREEAGVICVNPEPDEWHYNPRAPTLEGIGSEQALAMRQTPFTVSARPHASPGLQLVVASVRVDQRKSISGPICADRFHGAEATVVCRSLGLHFGQSYHTVPLEGITEFDVPYPLVTVGHCFGNESRLEDCAAFANPTGSPCSNQSVGVAVICASTLPDLEPDVDVLSTSSRGAMITLFQAKCALEENCFPPSVYNLLNRNKEKAYAHLRHLLRFSSIIHNVGTADFRPHEPRERWVWHDCHMHYHSMKVFTDYQVVDEDNQLLAVGHKASFCLEDNECKPGYAKKFVCSTTLSTRGDQGISPGCQDNYFHDYDCQWIDITDVPSGYYRFNIIINPNFLVPEISYANNAATCRLMVNNYNSTVTLSSCHLVHPYDLIG